MQPQLCSRCKKNVAVVFITKVENGVSLNEGYCLKCARSLGIPQIDAAVRQMGISEDDLDMLSDEMGNIFGQMDDTDKHDDDEVDSQTATFPLLNQLFGSSEMKKPEKAEPEEQENEEQKSKKKKKKVRCPEFFCRIFSISVFPIFVH